MKSQSLTFLITFLPYLLLCSVGVVSSSTLTAQTSLTKDEREILEKIKATSSATGGGGGGDDVVGNESSIPAILQEIQQSIHTEQNNLNDIHQNLNQHENHLEQFIQQYDTLYTETSRLLRDDVLEFNIQQLYMLRDRIVKSREEDLERRTLDPQFVVVDTIEEEVYVDDDNDNVDHNDTDDEHQEEEENEEESNVNDDISQKITKQELKEMISLEKILQDSEANNNNLIGRTIHQYISKAIPTKFVSPQIIQFEKNLEQKKIQLEQAKAYVTQTLEERRNDDEDDKKCVDHTNALNMVQTSIWKLENDDGLYDIFSNGNGAVVIHGDEWTSSSYVPQAQQLPKVKEDYDNGDDDDDDKRVTLGDYEQYMPEDWERLLPEGWKDVDVTFIRKFLSTDPRKQIPTSAWHSMPLPLRKLLSPPGNPIAVPKPPETIMTKNNHLGSCWAMPGSSGKVTLRLKEPRSIRSVTIDHYPGLPSAHLEQTSNGANTINRSAPRFVRVIGYPPCADEDADALECIKLGFDPLKPFDLGSFEYKPVPTIDDMYDEFVDEPNPRRSTQTFVLKPKLMKDDETSTEEESADDEDMFTGGSCTATKPSCGSDTGLENNDDDQTIVNAPVVASISFVIDENWGNDDFTCIYRIRVHG